MHNLVECVPNFSEGRDRARIKQITDAISAVAGVELMDVDPGADTNRTVVTFVGDPEAALEAAFQGVKKAYEVLDMSTHSGAHPRMGACDVCPFIPVSGLTMENCAELARRLGERVGRELGLPVYLYEAAARRPERKNLAVVRKGEYEGLAEKLKDPAGAPDFGPAQFNPRFGALIAGAREFLIAYNITLATKVKDHATDLAFELREKGRVARRGQTSPYYLSGEPVFYDQSQFPCGNCERDEKSFEDLVAHCREVHGYDLRHLLRLNDIDPDAGVVGKKAYRAGLFTHCKAIGWVVEEYGRAQLSINLTDYHVTAPHTVLEATRRMAAERGLVVTGSEIVGLVPCQALREAGEFYLRRAGRSPFVPAEDVLQAAVYAMGLGDVAPFEVQKKVLGLPKGYAQTRGAGFARTAGGGSGGDAEAAKRPGGSTHLGLPLGGMTVKAFTEEVSRDTPAPGGGSIAALAGGLGAALASMVANLAHPKATGETAAELLAIAQGAQSIKDALVLAVDEDTEAFNGYMEALRLPKGTEAEKARRSAAMQAGLKEAVAVPLRTAELSLQAMRLAQRAARAGNPASLTDALVGCACAFAGLQGGLWNVRINLKDLKDGAYIDAMEARCAELLADGEALMAEVAAEGQDRLSRMIAAKRGVVMPG